MSGLVVTFPDGQRCVQTATLAKQLRVNKKKIYRWVKEGRIPEPVRLNGRIQWHAVAKVKGSAGRLRAGLWCQRVKEKASWMRPQSASARQAAGPCIHELRIVHPTSCRYPNREVFPKEMVMAAWVYANYFPAGPVKDFIAGMLSEAEYATNQTVDNELSQE